MQSCENSHIEVSVNENHVIKDVTITSVSKGANEIIVKGNMSVNTMIKL